MRRWCCGRRPRACCGASSCSTTTSPAGWTATRPSPKPPAARKTARNSKWRNFDGFDIISMPDKWEYPWFAAWDLAFHTVTLAHLDPAFAKYQLILICREWFQHPQGALPAYEWDFGDVNPPVHAWAALQVFAIDGARDFDFLSRVFDKLLVNFTWWVNREDDNDNNVFEGGFLGLDNIGPIDRSHLPAGYTLEQSDATGWMGAYALALGAIAAVLTWSGQRKAQDLVLKFLEHFAGIRNALDQQGLWDETDGLFYDRLVTPSGYSCPGQDPVHGRDHPGAGRRGHRRRHAAQRADHEQELHAVPAERGGRGHAEAGRAPAAARRGGRPAAAASRWPGPPSWSGCSPSCSTRPSSCPRTGCARCRPTTAIIPTSSTPRATSPPSTMSRPSRPPPCSAATPTGAARSGCRSTTWWSNRWSATTGSTALTWSWSTRPGRASGSPWT